MVKVKEVPYVSPHKEVYVGLLMKYKGYYFRSGWEKGQSKVKRIFCEMTYHNGEREDNDTLAPVYAELENGKLVLLGYDSVVTGFSDKRQEWKRYLIKQK